MRFSAGLLPYRHSGPELQVFLVHMGGPLWEHRDDGAWSIAKGEYDPGQEDPREVAAREFCEEVGLAAPEGPWLDLGELHMPRARKTVRTYAVQTDEPLTFVSSNRFTMEWPPHSGRMGEFPETDGADWFDPQTARKKLLSGQVPIIDVLLAALGEYAQDPGAG